MEENTKLNLLYAALVEENHQIVQNITEIIKELKLFDFNHNMLLLKHESFQTQKIGIHIATFDKSFYNKQDTENLRVLRNYIESSFKERGTRTKKKPLLSSKEKEVWNCECGKTNDLDSYCYDCGQNIDGFIVGEIKPKTALRHIDQKIDLISEYLK